MPCVEFGFFRIKKSMQFHTSNSSYGDFFFLQEGKPKFYFNALSINGKQNDISQYIEVNNLKYDSFLIELLEKKGYKDLKPLKNESLSVKFEKKSYLKEYTLIQIIPSSFSAGTTSMPLS